jgi:hypothetical protein
MTTNRQLLVAVGLAAAVLAIGLRESSQPETEPLLVAEARMRQSLKQGAAAQLREDREPDADFPLEPSDGGLPGGPSGALEEDFAKLPLVQIMALLSGGSAAQGDVNNPAVVSNPDADWRFLERADSILRDSRLSGMMEKLLRGSGAGGGR